MKASQWGVGSYGGGGSGVAKIEELRELSVDTSYEREVYNAIDFRIFRCYHLSSAPLEA